LKPQAENPSRRTAAAALLLAGALAPATALAAPQLDPVWTDHAVVQRGRPIVVEGTAAPRSGVEARLGAQTVQVRADRAGRFTAEFAPLEASADPLTLTVADSSGTATVSDIVIGDVWLCSGQSNMEWSVSVSTGGDQAARDSADDGLRLLQIPKDTAPTPQRTFSTPVAWATASPASVPAFSAACYYMARALRKELGVPIGAIHASWGGSQARAWLSPEGGRALYGPDQMELLAGYAKDPLAAVAAFAPVWQQWWKGAAGTAPWDNPDALEWRPVPRIAPWTAWGEGAPAPVGNVWFRRMIELTPQQAAAGGILNIGIIDDLDATWVNGHPVGISHGWSTEREYRVPPAFLRAGVNEIVFAASNSWGAGGIQSSADRLSFAVDGGERIALGEGWLYADSGVPQMPPRAPWDANAGIGVMHNKMVAPLGRIALAGAAWYQGESDVGIPGYADRLRELFAGWRRQFGKDARMLVVQLPNFGEVAERPVAAGWAELREQQRRAVAADANAALIPTLDVGEHDDLHPPHKLPVGLRLAAAALGRAMPMPLRATRDGQAITVTFSGLDGGLHAWSGPPLGVELCGETQDSCRYAETRIEGDRLLIAAGGRPATRVRYAWADAPVVNPFAFRAIAIPSF
jgi:sialate O-acetylesterase